MYIYFIQEIKKHRKCCIVTDITILISLLVILLLVSSSFNVFLYVTSPTDRFQGNYYLFQLVTNRVH